MFDFRKLEAFCKVYELRSFSRAGEALFLSQPTVSAHVQALEKEAGARLLDRMGRSVLPTPAGVALYRRAIKAFAELASAQSEIRSLTGDIAGGISLGASTIPASFLLPDVVTGFVRAYPKVTINLVVGDSAGVIRKVLDGDVMLAVVGAVENNPELEFTPIVNDELVLVAAPALKALGKIRQRYGLDKLYRWPWIMREEGSGTRKSFEQGFTRAGGQMRELGVVLEVDSTQAALQYAVAGLGVTVSSRLAAQKQLARSELIELKAAGLSFKRNFYIVHNLRRDMFPAASEFSSFIYKNTAHLRSE